MNSASKWWSCKGDGEDASEARDCLYEHRCNKKSRWTPEKGRKTTVKWSKPQRSPRLVPRDLQNRRRVPMSWLKERGRIYISHPVITRRVLNKGEPLRSLLLGINSSDWSLSPAETSPIGWTQEREEKRKLNRSNRWCCHTTAFGRAANHSEMTSASKSSNSLKI